MQKGKGVTVLSGSEFSGEAEVEAAKCKVQVGIDVLFSCLTKGFCCQ